MMLHDTSAAAKSRPEHRSILSSRVEYCSHYNQYRNLKFNASTQLYLFGALYSLSKYKNIYFREKTSQKSKYLSLSLLYYSLKYYFAKMFVMESQVKV